MAFENNEKSLFKVIYSSMSLFESKFNDFNSLINSYDSKIDIQSILVENDSMEQNVFNIISSTFKI